ncbi:NAD(P)/FAD-dependent oxidoreductase [Occultella gossypii]|uniref:FAD-dependent oxidoreductase n=1 Tax=Occultella gossypii TaxID=2800820 RepID=A0ABS7S5H9_9MICO|nr:FAD-dependent oxidoreductase [Occultella gossypii]MBZ2195604.1 FAD-dependent oxidoreductase [Occultella gossypii]
MKHRIVILGAGYAGASVTGRLARRLHADDVEITLVNGESDFVERVRMHQLATGADLRPLPLRAAYAGTGVRVRVGRVESVDVEARTVSFTEADGEHSLTYDTLVYALGSTQNDGGVPGASEHAHEIASRPGALRLRERLAALGPGGRVVVVGGGLTGIEAVTEIAESRPDLQVALTTRGELGYWLSPAGRRHLHRVVDRLGITVHEGADVASVGEAGVLTTDAATIGADITVWTGGFTTHPIAAASALTVTDRGRIVVDDAMRSVSHPDVYAVGDAGQARGPKGNLLRMSCASGIPMAWRAADSIVAELTGAGALRIPLSYVQQCISLGRRDGLIQMVTSDDRARPLALTGRFAARYKEMICWGAGLVGRGAPLPYPARRRRLSQVTPSTGSSAPGEPVAAQTSRDFGETL